MKPRLGSTKLPFTASAALMLTLLSTLLLIAAQPANAQKEKVLYSFCSQLNCADGESPVAQLIADNLGNFYGTTFEGGTNGYGVVYKLSPSGKGFYTESVLYSFCSESGCTDGDPQCDLDGDMWANNYLTFDKLGNLYGTTCGGGANGYGIVFELSPGAAGWTETVLYNFCSQANCTDGAYPLSGLLWDQSGNLYGASDGSVFELSPNGGGGWTEEVIYSAPIGYSGLSMDTSGNIYGVSDSDNPTSYVFQLAPPTTKGGGWTATIILTTSWAETAPVPDSDGNLYGTTYFNGSKGYGTVYKLTPAKGVWKEKTLYNFPAGNNGANPWGSPTLDSAGNIYGTTQAGGKYGTGTVWELAVNGTGYKEKILWSFNDADGDLPYGALLLYGGNLYGTTESGGSNGGICGGGVNGHTCGEAFEVTP
jgi:uncharacterized repeat protein (TIGR03803 family)